MSTDDLPRPEVPDAIAVVRDFVNTTDHETDTDELTTRAALVRYLGTAGLLAGPARATQEDLALALRLRAGLREALELNHDGDARSLESLDEALAELPVALSWSGRAGSPAPDRDRGPRGTGPDRSRRPRRRDGRHLVASQDLRVRRVRVGLLRPLEEPVPQLLRVRLRQQAQDPRLPGPPARGRPARSTGRRLRVARRRPRRCRGLRPGRPRGRDLEDRQRGRGATELGADRLVAAPVAQPAAPRPPVTGELGPTDGLPRSPRPCARWRAGRPRRARSAASRRCRGRSAAASTGMTPRVRQMTRA